MHVVNGEVSPEFARFVADLAAAFPTTGKPSAATFLAYGYGLADFTVAEIRAAVKRALDAGALSPYFPSLPELRRIVAGSADDAVLLAWAAFRRAADDVGAWASVEIVDAAAAEALVAVFGSWPAFCAEEEGPTLGQRRAEFAAAYRAARRALGPRAPSRRLPGLCEARGTYHGGPGVVRGVIDVGGAVKALPDATPKLLSTGSITEP